MHTPKSMAQLLAGSPDSLHAVLAHTQRLEHLNRALQHCLPTPLNQHCQVANLRDNTLILHADSSAWALKLRYSTTRLLQQLRQQPRLQALRTIEVKVRPISIAMVRPEKIRHAHMSKKTARLLDDIADNIIDDRLKMALRRLARHGQSG